jgi:hypothetical protein
VQKTISTVGSGLLSLGFHGRISSADRRKNPTDTVVRERAGDLDFLVRIDIGEGIYRALVVQIIATHPSPAYSNSFTNFSEGGFI